MFFINENYINSLIEDESLQNEDLQRYILRKAGEAGGLTLKESASLLNISSPELYDDLFTTARSVKEKIYGSRIILFAPLHITNVCVNNCPSCVLRRDNPRLKRKSLTVKEIVEEVRYLILAGQRILLLITGENPEKATVPYIGNIISKISELSINGNSIRRVDVNSLPLGIEEFRELKNFGIGLYQCFLETYEYNTYLQIHPHGQLRDYGWRLYAMERALQAGIDDVGIGSVFGLTDYRFETLALLSHAFDLDMKYGIGPHTVSIPRIKPILNMPAALSSPCGVDDLSLKKLAAVIRLAIPYTGIVLSDRESAELRRELLALGISQISAGGRTSPADYKESRESLNDYELEQFHNGDNRHLDEVVREITLLGYLPSFCTACYRTQRTGNKFMELTRSGDMGKTCTLNAIVTFKDYLNNFASGDIIKPAGNILRKELNKIDVATGKKAEEMIGKVIAGERDVYL